MDRGGMGWGPGRRPCYMEGAAWSGGAGCAPAQDPEKDLANDQSRLLRCYGGLVRFLNQRRLSSPMLRRGAACGNSNEYRLLAL